MFRKAKLVFIFLCMTSMTLAGEIIPVVVKKSDVTPLQSEQELFMLNGMRQALTKELLDQKMDQEIFWKNIEAKKLPIKEEISFFQPLFKTSALLPNNVIEVSAAASSTAPIVLEDLFIRASFEYELDPALSKKFFSQIISNLPDVTLKAFYIVGDITLHPDLSWSDVGVSRKENFAGVILDSWKKWVKEEFKSFENIVILDKDFDQKSEDMNSESVILRWNSQVKRSSLNTTRKTAQFEVSSQYILQNAKGRDLLVAFDFPLQKREVSVHDPKELSSTLASLIYNLLNSQLAKISMALETHKSSSVLNSIEMAINGDYGLSDIYIMSNYLSEKFKEIKLSLTLKTFSSGNSTVTLKTSASTEILYQMLSQENGKFPLSEQKVLVFNPETKTFAIIRK